ncbi:hypothetical protein A45J_0923 [hot springs metagenome]|uniref:Uncharacterized protein n=1 Tax=hot springs metagenome TaxID=433727 RepID=A0A5J4KU53_9ZZZZ
MNGKAKYNDNFGKQAEACFLLLTGNSNMYIFNIYRSN